MRDGIMTYKGIHKSNSYVFSFLSDSVRHELEAERLIHELAMEENILDLIDNLALDIEGLEFESIPHIFNAIFQRALRGNPQAEKVLLCLLCGSELEKLIPNNRYQLIWEEILAQDYLDLWNCYNKVHDLFRNSSHILAVIILFLLDISRQFSKTLYVHHSIYNVIDILRAFYNTCHEKGIGEIAYLKLSPEDFARILLQRKETELVEKFYNDLTEILAKKGFEKKDDGTYEIDVVAKLIKKRKEKKEDEVVILAGEDYHFEVITDAVVEEAREKTKQFLLGEKLTLARRQDRKWLQFLIYDRNPMVVESVLKNEHIYEREVALLANKRSTPAKILEKIYDAIEIILPYLIPFMNFVRPLVSGFGNFLRNLIAPFYSSLNLPADYYITRNFIPYYIIGGFILLFAIFAAIGYLIDTIYRISTIVQYMYVAGGTLMWIAMFIIAGLVTLFASMFYVNLKWGQVYA